MTSKYFNTTGNCIKDMHYMVDITSRLKEIKKLIDRGQYFTINRARQYGKTTTLMSLPNFLKDEYIVISLDFQGLSHACFQSEQSFTSSFSSLLLSRYPDFVSLYKDAFNTIIKEKDSCLDDLFKYLSLCCEKAENPVVLLIDEVDSASNNQLFLDFLAQLRYYYLNRANTATFQSVILAGVHDVKNLKMKLHPGEESKKNSPWNIAADFDVKMSFSPLDIQGMLSEYESDYKTGMNVNEISNLIYDYTSGYPFLVSRICKLIDEKIVETQEFPRREDAWTTNGVLKAVKLIMNEKNTLFDSLKNKIVDYEGIRNKLYALVFLGNKIAYNAEDDLIDILLMFGFAKKVEEEVRIANRIFETKIYNYFMSVEPDDNKFMNQKAYDDKPMFIKDGVLDIRLILERFSTTFNDIYGNNTDAFKESEGRKYFLLYMQPIINGVGNYYIEAETRDRRRTDVIIDYLGKQYVIELKIWHGDEYNKRGEEQLLNYLDYYHLDTGYMLSFNFNKSKVPGVKEISLNCKKIIEAVV